jgi:DNA gyrase subunit A
MGRNSRGVKGITLEADDAVVGMVVADPEGYLLTVCENGFGKRTPFGPNEGPAAAESHLEEEVAENDLPETEPVDASADDATTSRSSMRYRVQRRGGKGLRDIKTSERNGPVVAVLSVRDGDEMMLITQQGMVTRIRVDEVRVTGRNTLGVRLIQLNEGDRVVGAAKIAREDLDSQLASSAPATESPAPSSPEAEIPSSGESAPDNATSPGHADSPSTNETSD